MRIVSKPLRDREPPRMRPLSVLPVFFSLEGKTALVCGGADAAAWKAELLEAAGAFVRVIAPAAENIPQGAAVWLYLPPDQCRILSG